MREKIFFIIGTIEACEPEIKAVCYSLVSLILNQAETPEQGERAINLMYERLKAA